MTLSLIAEVVPQVYPGVRLISSQDDDRVWLAVSDHELGVHSYLVIDPGEAPLAGDVAVWMDGKVKELLRNHQQPANQMVPWREALPSVDAATYLLGADL